MSKTLFTAVLLLITFAAFVASARAGGPLGIDDLPKMHKTYADNEAKFRSLYYGEAFEAVLPFHSATTSMFSGKTLHVRLGEGAFLGDVECDVGGDADIAMIAKLDKGDNLTVRGVIDGSTMGTIDLGNCSVSR